MQYRLPLYSAIIVFTFLGSCNFGPGKCEEVGEYKVQNYRIVKSKCPDMVLAYYFDYDLYIDNKRIKAGAIEVDSCVFTCQVENERFLILNTCDNSIQELKPHKIPLDASSIDSITIFSNEQNQTTLLTSNEVEKFTADWNNSNIRGYSDKPFDSAFSFYPAFQYKLIVFSKGTQRPFYGYNYLVLDSSSWEYEMGKTEDYNYFHNYWKK